MPTGGRGDVSGDVGVAGRKTKVAHPTIRAFVKYLFEAVHPVRSPRNAYQPSTNKVALVQGSVFIFERFAVIALEGLL
jgi:hypothetical protein